MGVAEPAIAAARQHDPVAGLCEIRDQRIVVLIEDLCPGRRLQHHVGASRARAILALAMAALLRLEVLLVAIVEQRVEVRHAFDNHVAAAAAVAPVRAAKLDELLPPEADAPIAPVARAHINLGLIEKLHGEGLALASCQYTRARRRLAYARRKPASAAWRS